MFAKTGKVITFASAKEGRCVGWWGGRKKVKKFLQN